jgi:hypothetical protein
MLGRYCDPVILRVMSFDKRRTLSHSIKMAAGVLAAHKSINPRVPMRVRTLLGQNFYGSWTFDDPL